MATPFVTPNMGLTEPTVGVTPSVSWALILNADIGILDNHNHTPGQGVPVPPSGLNINTDLSFQGNNLLALNSGVFAGSVAGTPAPLSYYSNGTDLFYTDINGTSIQLTKAGSPNAGTGNISGLPSSPTGGAGIAWVNGSSTFQLLLDAGTVGANLDAGTLVMRYPGSYPTPAGNYIALRVPSGLSSGYALTLPGAIPASNSFMQFNSDGSLSAGPLVTGGLTTTNLSASAAILGTQLAASANILGSQLSSSAGIIGHQLVSNVNFDGWAQTDGENVISSNTSAAHGLGIVRGSVVAGGSFASGEGFSVTSHPSTGVYNISFLTAFNDVPVVVASAIGNGGQVAMVSATTNSTLTITVLSGSTPTNLAFGFIAIGQRQ